MSKSAEIQGQKVSSSALLQDAMGSDIRSNNESRSTLSTAAGPQTQQWCSRNPSNGEMTVQVACYIPRVVASFCRVVREKSFYTNYIMLPEHIWEIVLLIIFLFMPSSFTDSSFSSLSSVFVYVSVIQGKHTTNHLNVAFIISVRQYYTNNHKLHCNYIDSTSETIQKHTDAQINSH